MGFKNDNVLIEVTRSARMETILGKSPAIFNGHQPPRTVYPYMDTLSVFFKALQLPKELPPQHN